MSNVAALTRSHLAVRFRYLMDIVKIDPQLTDQNGDIASRAAIAQALNLLLLADLAERTPTAAAYLEDLEASDGMFVFDHGALRTIDLADMGTLPRGRRAIARLLKPLGYQKSAVYPLEKLSITGYSYTHRDFPEALPQFFVSELHVDRFSAEFQAAIARVTETSEDPLDAGSRDRLDRLEALGALPMADALALLPILVAAFDRQHEIPFLADYETLLAESPEAAWIATEGNSFNHATSRVADLTRLVAEQRLRGRPMKDRVEISATGRVRQTAYKADPVQRSFIGPDGELMSRTVPGSFFEFIERARISDANGKRRLDLSFDSSNAQGIFKMTAT